MKICVVTATRAEYGLLKGVIQKIHSHAELELCLIATGTHLSHDFGFTVDEIVNDNIPIAEKVDILMNGDNPSSVSKTMGVAFISFADVLYRHAPDMILVLGDRYELIPICCCALNLRIPIAHISGGETTEGAIDECFRHSITKMSQLHFVGCEQYRKRVIQLGESPDRVFNFGDVGVEAIENANLLNKIDLETSLHFDLGEHYASVTFHPVTMENNSAEEQITELLTALDLFPQLKFVFTKSNSDTNSRIINTKIDEFVATRDNCVAFQSLGLTRYLSLVKHSCMVIGNSSSGIIEAPILGIPTVNIGDRQKGRLQANSIINCIPYCNNIVSAMNTALSDEFIKKSINTVSPYQRGNTSERIVCTIKEFLFNSKIELKKQFYDIKFEETL